MEERSAAEELLSPSAEPYHCCATCMHYMPSNRSCGRLGYATSPKYKFHCWVPSERVQRAMRLARKKGRSDKGD